jgi:uncharacterized protein (DUF305 family)
MTMSTEAAEAETGDAAVERPQSGAGLRRVLLAVNLVALLVLAGAAGWLLRGGGTKDTPNAADVGFAQDMSVHHTQAVTMAGYERDNTTDTALRILAFDIETSQESQVGEMQGWLDTWGKSRNNPNPMQWMGAEHASLVHDGLMPGMATPAQINRLETLHGKALDILFLQLMIRHHQGGVAMAQFALQHAKHSYVRDLAQSILNEQQPQVVQMEQILRQQFHAQPLPAPQT